MHKSTQTTIQILLPYVETPETQDHIVGVRESETLDISPVRTPEPFQTVRDHNDSPLDLSSGLPFCMTPMEKLRADSGSESDGAVQSCPVKAQQTRYTNNHPFGSRLFISFTQYIPEDTLHDLFSKFGTVEKAFLLPGKKYGYAKMATVEAASAACAALNNKVIGDLRCRVVRASAQLPQEASTAKRAQQKTGRPEDRNRKSSSATVLNMQPLENFSNMYKHINPNDALTQVLSTVWSVLAADAEE